MTSTEQLWYLNTGFYLKKKDKKTFKLKTLFFPENIWPNYADIIELLNHDSWYNAFFHFISLIWSRKWVEINDCL